MKPILTCIAGDNSDLFAQAAQMYLREGCKVADVTYGRGVFWKNINVEKYRLVASDKATLPKCSSGVDFCQLPYADDSFDAVVFDPPYMNGGTKVKQSLNKCYKNPGHNSHESVIVLYLRGMLESRRILKKGGVLFVKCQPAVADHKQRSTHVQLMTVAPMIGLNLEDEFVLHQSTIPLMRHSSQSHARKNHSYLLVFRKSR